MKSTSEFQILIDAVNKYKDAMVQLGFQLGGVKDHYEDVVGEGITNWSDFLAQPELGLSVREANSLITLSNWLGGIGVPLRDLNLATAKFAALRGISENVDDMKVLSVKDWKERHHEEKTNNAPQTYTYLVMRRSKETGNLTRVYGVEDLEEQIKERVDE